MRVNVTVLEVYVSTFYFNAKDINVHGSDNKHKFNAIIEVEKGFLFCDMNLLPLLSNVMGSYVSVHAQH